MKTLLFILALAITSCAPRAFQPGTPNPLDEPGQVEPTAAELHQKNIRFITGIPAW